jgi:hypothetical protein
VWPKRPALGVPGVSGPPGFGPGIPIEFPPEEFPPALCAQTGAETASAAITARPQRRWLIFMGLAPIVDQFGKDAGGNDGRELNRILLNLGKDPSISVNAPIESPGRYFRRLGSAEPGQAFVTVERCRRAHVSVRITIAVVSAAFVAGTVGIACAQGSITQDPRGTRRERLAAARLAERAWCDRHDARVREQCPRRPLRQCWWWVLDQPARRQSVTRADPRLNLRCSGSLYG